MFNDIIWPYIYWFPFMSTAPKIIIELVSNEMFTTSLEAAVHKVKGH